MEEWASTVCLYYLCLPVFTCIPAQVIELSKKNNILVRSVMEEWVSTVCLCYLCLPVFTCIPAQVIELSKKNNILVSSVMEETGGVGVDCVPVFTCVYLYSSPGDRAE